MSLAGFRSTNHPQQTAKRGAKDAVDDRGTEWEFIRSLEARLGWGAFDLDVAAAPHNAKAPKFYTREDDGLTQPWSIWGVGWDINVWCNPPYSDCRSWIEKAWKEWNDGTRNQFPGWTGDYRSPGLRPNLIVMLLPANRVEQKWWQELVEPYRDRPGSPLRVEFLPGRMRFDRPGWEKPAKGDRPPFGCCLLIWESR